MLYRELGKTGYRVSQLGFGAMRLPTVGEGLDVSVNRELAIPMIHTAFEAGVNYIDTAVGYCNLDSQRAVGEALKGWRDKIVVSTKNPYYGKDEGEWWKNLENSLELLDIDCIDIYNHHAAGWDRYTEFIEPLMGKWMVKAKDQGLIKHIGCSFHDSNDALVKLVDSGYPEVIILQYNLLDRQLEEGIAYAKEKGVAIVVMGPVGGGRLGVTSEVFESLVPNVKRVPELALRFVLNNPNISVALSGMSTMQQVVENLATASDARTLSDEEKAAIDEHLVRLKKMAELYCSGCKYCQPCPQEVRIPEIFTIYNLGRVYGLWENARADYANIGTVEWFPGGNGSACTECGACEEKCPQKLKIREQLKEAHAALAKKA